MQTLRLPLWLLLLVGALSLGGCEPYMSMTDQLPTQTRRAAALLPDGPRFVGMVNVEQALGQMGGLTAIPSTDSLRRTGAPRLRTFLDATGFDPRTDVTSAYGAVGEDGDALSIVAFADLGPDQLDRYLDQAGPGAGTRTDYRDVPLYHLALCMGDCGDASEAPPDTLSLAFVQNGTIALALNRSHVRAIVDRHRDDRGGLRDNDAYMKLVERVGRDRTAWLVGRNVIETALRDSAATGQQESTDAPDAVDEEAPAVRAGLQGALVEWSNRVLGLSSVPSNVSMLEGRGKERLQRLRRKVREQAVALTLTDAGLEGEVFLTMSNEASASSVTDIAEGLLAVLRLSRDELTARQQNVLDQATVEQDGALVRVRFSLARDYLRMSEDEPTTARAPTGGVRRVDAAVRPADVATRRWASIIRPASW